jgi:hypothetical protein
MTGDWEATEHAQIQVRAVVKDRLQVKSKPDRVLEGQGRLLDTPGPTVTEVSIDPTVTEFEVRVFVDRRYVPPGKIRCDACRKVLTTKKDGKPRRHLCDPALAWKVNGGFETRQRAYA